MGVHFNSSLKIQSWIVIMHHVRMTSAIRTTTLYGTEQTYDNTRADNFTVLCKNHPHKVYQ